MNTRQRISSGFTLIELLATVAVIGILASLAMPAFTSLIQSQQIKTASFELYAALNVARSEAIKRNNIVTVTPDASGWQAGWSIKDSFGANLKTHGVLKGVVIAGPASMVYTSSGRANAGGAFQLDTGTTTTANVRCIKIDLSGMPRTFKGACT